MTPDQFQRLVHDYRVSTEREAQQDAARLNAEGIDGDEAVVVEFPRLGWCLMLRSAADYLKEMRIPR